MAVTQQAILNAIYAKLTASHAAGTVYAAVEGRIYDTIAPQNVKVPFVVFSIADDPIQQYFTIDSIQVDFQVDVYGAIVGDLGGPKATRQIGDIAYTLLHRSAITITGYSGCSILCQTRSGLDTDLIFGGRTQQDAFRDTRMYRLFGTGS